MTTTQARWVDLEQIDVGLTPDGRMIRVVKRMFGGFSQYHYGSASVGAAYWTVVQQTMPGRDKWQAVLPATRFWGSWRDSDDRDAAVRAAQREIEMLAAEYAFAASGGAQ